MTSAEGYPWLAGSLPIAEPEVLAKVLSEVADISLSIDKTGVIKSGVVNPDTAPVESVQSWVGRNLADLLTPECLPKLERVLQEASREDRPEASVLHVELNHGDASGWQYPVRYSVHHGGYARNTILLLGRDLGPIAETQQKLVQAQMALEQGYEELRGFDARFRILLSVSQEAIVLVKPASGLIEELNEVAAQLLGGTVEGLRGKSIDAELRGKGRKGILDQLIEGEGAIPCQTSRSQTDVMVEPASFRASGEQMLICRLKPEGQPSAVVDALTANLDQLFRNGPEAIVFTDDHGVIKQANEAFLALANVPDGRGLEGVSLSDILLRGQVDLGVLLKNAAHKSGLRRFSTKLRDAYGVSTPVEISASLLKDKGDATIGLIFRSGAMADAAPNRAPDPSGGVQRSNVTDLVGSASLKDIVSRTTDVIERMCIEAAIELTGNNRAAAAEMLGLSRQSLYSKLNKFDMQEKPPRDQR